MRVAAITMIIDLNSLHKRSALFCNALISLLVHYETTVADTFPDFPIG